MGLNMSDARTQFLETMKSVSDVCDSELIRRVPSVEYASNSKSSLVGKQFDFSSENGLSENASSLVCKGLMVAAFNAFENFIEERWIELLNSTQSHIVAFQDLPDQTQLKMIRNVIGVLGRYHFDSDELGALKGQLIEVGTFFANVNSGGGYIHPFVGRWQGSNISAAALGKGLGCFHVRKPWESMQKVYDVVLGSFFPSVNIDLYNDFDGIVQRRHSAAHDMHSVITRLSLSEVPGLLRNVAFCFDVLASSAVHLMRVADNEFLKDDRYVKPILLERYWEIRRREHDFAAYERVGAFDSSSGQLGSVRAKKVDVSDRELLKWVQKKRRDLEFVVQLSASGSLISWETCI